jgi:thiol-disulfide isomerase/thioredoxin
LALVLPVQSLFGQMAPAPAASQPSAAVQNAASRPATRSAQEIMADLRANGQAVGQALGSSQALSDPAQRKAIAPKAIPALKKLLSNFKELADAQPAAKEQVSQAEQQFLALLSVLGDQDSTNQLQAMADSKDQAESIRGQGGQLLARWITAGKDVAAQTKVVDDLEKLDKAHTDNTSLTMLTATLSQGAASPELSARLEKIATETMNNPMVDQIKQGLAAEKAQKAEMDAAEAKMKQLENKPMEVKGKTVDGKDFSTAAWKGKVVLVDFWATWCGPCVAELPRVQKIYTDYHAKGLEILGVSNDFDAKALTDFTAKEKMPWPQLFDATAAAGHQWNPVTLGYGINGIPTMFLIDKKGVCRSVDAREKMEEMIPKLLAE